MLKRLVPVLTMLAAVVLLLMLNFTTPAEVGPLGVLVFFIAVYILMYGLALVIVTLFTKVTGKKTGRRTYVYSTVVAFGPIMLMLAQSMGSMSLGTVGLAALFVFLACFLIAKRSQVN